MPRIQYIEKRFNKSSKIRIVQAIDIIEEYQKQGFDLTLRQLYYQFVSRDLLPNTQKSYNNLGSLISDARLAGYIDWNAIQDRTRNLRANPHWDSPAELVDACAAQFQIDRWERQGYRPEVWIEKDALVGVIEGVCNKYDVPYFSCRGYTSQSEMWRAGRRLAKHIKNGQTPIIFHLGDHDPSGIDMSRDIQDRLSLFIGNNYDFEFQRIALNMDQIEQYGPPPNPAKITDSRAGAYIAEHGYESWELDALEPQSMVGLIEESIGNVCDFALYEEAVNEEKNGQESLQLVADNWDVALEKLK